jgi:AP2 domain
VRDRSCTSSSVPPSRRSRAARLVQIRGRLDTWRKDAAARRLATAERRLAEATRKKRIKIHHGMSSCPEYRAWVCIKKRCCDPRDAAYADYGGRGICICSEWINDFPAFYAHVGPRPDAQHSIDRINNNLGYQYGNVRWTTATVQTWNQRKRAGTSSKFKGVFFRKSSGKWLAHIGQHYERHYLGMHETEEAAARAYDTASIELYGHAINFPSAAPVAMMPKTVPEIVPNPVTETLAA